MAKTPYERGRNKEYRITSYFKKRGWNAVRTAGSHGIFDVIAIDPFDKRIRLIQSKLGKLSDRQREKLLEEGKDLNGWFEVSFEVWGSYT